MNIFTITIPAQSISGNLNFTVKVEEYDGTWTKIFDGKVYVTSGQTSVNIELEDILWSYKFDGTNFFSPMLSPTGDYYGMSSTEDQLSNYWYNQVRVDIPALDVYTIKYVHFYKSSMFGRRIDDVEDGTVAFFMNHQPICHLPPKPPAGFQFRQLVWNGTFRYSWDYSRNVVVSRTKLGTITFPVNATTKYSINNIQIATIDSCPKPYYLVWLTNTGTMQCQGFLKGSEFSVKYENNNRVDMSNFKWNYNKGVSAQWRLKSINLNDADYHAYGELFDSPYLLLIDTETGRLHYVNIKDDTYNRKRNGVNGNRKIFFEVTVESCEVKMI